MVTNLAAGLPSASLITVDMTVAVYRIVCLPKARTCFVTNRSSEAPGPGSDTWAVAGPMATMTLASLGADVIKVETSLRLDVLRRSAFTGSTTNRQKKAITLNLRHEKAVALAKRLVAQSDVVAESFRPGVMDGLGLAYPDLKSVKEDIIMLSSSMAGQRGPYARFAGYAPMFVALSGLGDMTGYEDGPPTQIRVGGDIIVSIDGKTITSSEGLANEIETKKPGQTITVKLDRANGHGGYEPKTVSVKLGSRPNSIPNPSTPEG